VSGRETIPPALAGERVDRVVSLVADVSRSEATRLVAAGAVRLDGVVATAGKERVAADQTLEIDQTARATSDVPVANPAVDIDVVHADEHLVVVDKPAGLVVHPAPGHHDDTLVNGLLARFPEIGTVGEPHRPGIVHRLDVGTSGLLLVARTDRAHAELTAALRQRRVTREYLAVVCGLVENDTGVIEAPVGRDPRDPMRMAVVVTGRPSRTRFEVVARYAGPDTTLVRCRLETGRTHQIRVHLAAVGHPVLADATYGGVRERVTLHRPFLHAALLRLVHPVTGASLVFTSPLPDDLSAVLATLTPHDRDGVGETERSSGPVAGVAQPPVGAG
jgi:23S rRNA pseudouridine1911/1915/1917 synthase